GTRVKQVGYVTEQNWTQPLATGEVSGVIVVQVKRYAVDETQPDELGVELVEFNPRQPVRLIGTNDTLLAADTGEVVAQRTTENPADWQALVQAKADELHPRPVILQGDGLELLRKQAMVTEDEIRRHLAAAPAYHFAPKDGQGQPILAA
ncbi:MAG: hypothetical protein ACRYFZ_12005, partial [Janthinobacterium lividum]